MVTQRKIQPVQHKANVSSPDTTQLKLVRVAAYCLVSTLQEEQDESYATQCEYFRSRIATDCSLTLVDIYGDHGISGLSANSRPEFMRMMEDCRNGKVDMIMAKSISRFTRNLADYIECVRELRSLGIAVILEKENLNTLDPGCEMLLSVLAALAQEESHSISENMKWGVRKRFAAGIPKWSPTYGYINRNGEYIINEEQAVGVRRIFELYIEGKSLPQVAKILNQEGIPSMEGGKWWPKTVGEILVNPKYVCDEEMQKTYVVNHITHKKVRNDHSIVPGYRITGHHKRIVDRHTFELAGLILKMKDRHNVCVKYPYRGKLICPVCDSSMICAVTDKTE